MENPTVFISYSHDNDEHRAWVLKLATDLRYHGVNAILDQWDLRIGTDLRFFMENGLSASTLVLCVCSENYVRKVDTGTGGSGYEGMIMTQGLLQNAKAEYVIPIVRNNPSAKKVPVAFAGKLYTDFSDDSKYDSKYQELLERIYGEDTKKKPPLGNNPFSSTTAHTIDIRTNIEKDLYSSAKVRIGHPEAFLIKKQYDDLLSEIGKFNDTWKSKAAAKLKKKIKDIGERYNKVSKVESCVDDITQIVKDMENLGVYTSEELQNEKQRLYSMIKGPSIKKAQSQCETAKTIAYKELDSVKKIRYGNEPKESWSSGVRRFIFG